MPEQEVAVIVGGGPGISASCARLFSENGFRVAVAARNIEKSSLLKLQDEHGVSLYRCDAAQPDSVAALFQAVAADLGSPRLVVHNIDGRSAEIFRKAVTEAAPAQVLDVLKNSTFSAFLTGQQAARAMLAQAPDDNGMRGTIIFTNASAAMKGYARSGAFAAASQGKSGLAQSMARELMPDGIHVAHVPIDGAIGRLQQDGSRGHWLVGTAEHDNMVDPDHIAGLYLQLHRQHRSTWAYEIVLRPWVENW